MSTPTHRCGPGEACWCLFHYELRLLEPGRLQLLVPVPASRAPALRRRLRAYCGAAALKNASTVRIDNAEAIYLYVLYTDDRVDMVSAISRYRAAWAGAKMGVPVPESVKEERIVAARHVITTAELLSVREESR